MDSKDTKFCMHCGKKIPKASKVCPFCGARQEKYKLNPNDVKDNQSSNTQSREATTKKPQVHKRNKANGKSKHKHVKYIILAILAVLIVLGCGKLYAVHHNHVVTEQAVTRFKDNTGTSSWKVGIGTFLNHSHTRADVLTSNDNYKVTKGGIDTTNSNSLGTCDYILQKNGFTQLIGFNEIMSQDTNLKGGTNMLAEDSTVGHTTDAQVDTNSRDIGTVADSIGTPTKTNFIIFKAIPKPSKGIKSNQFVILINK